MGVGWGREEVSSTGSYPLSQHPEQEPDDGPG